VNEVVREFLLETHENLAQLDVDLVTLERDPAERETLARVFRTIHTVKGSAGFLGFARLEAVTHAGENLLSRLRAGSLPCTPEVVTALLRVVDAIRRVVASIEQTEAEGDADFSDLIRTLEALTTERRSATPRPVIQPPEVTPPGQPAYPHSAPTRVGGSPFVPSTPPLSPLPAPPQAQAAPAARAEAPPPSASVVFAEPPEPVEKREHAVADSAIRVDVGLLDKLMTLVGELVLARNQIVQYGNAQEDTSFLATVQRLNLLTTELQAGVMKTRMQPIANVWGKFPRVVRDVAVACGKQARLEMDGKDTELDKTIIEAIRDPLTHLVRNAVDHGIEPPTERVARGKPAEGRLSLHATHEGGKVIIEISDDGAGIDPQRVRDKAVSAKLLTAEQAARLSERELIDLIFLPGFSTTDRVTNFSGRGVGMDVVRTNVEKIGGTVDVESRLGRGTTVKMKIPLTLAIIPALIISTGGDRYAIPQVNLLELVRLEGEQVQRGVELIHGTPVYRLRGNLLPLVYLDGVLQIESARGRDDTGGEVNVVVLQADDQQFGLVVDAIHDTEEIVVKPLQKQLKGISAFAGVTIMGDGKLALILDVLGLAQMANVVSAVRGRTINDKPVVAAESAAEKQTVLVFTTPSGSRMAIPLSLVARLEEFRRTELEKAGALDVIQYRNEILPLFHVSRELRRLRAAGGASHVKRAAGKARPVSETVPVIVYNGRGRRAGLVVGEILDVVQEDLATRARAARPGVLFSAVVQGLVTEFLDVEAVIRSADPGFFSEPSAVSGQRSAQDGLG
jgi:two-component system chemotaxis sensor kinase CheA